MQNVPVTESQFTDLINQYNQLRSTPPSSVRTLATDNLARSLMTALRNLDMFVEHKLIENMESWLLSSKSEAHTAITLLQITRTATNFHVTDSILKKLLPLLAEPPNFTQHLARETIGSLILADYIPMLESLPQSGETEKRTFWIQSLSTTVQKQLQGPTKDQFLGCFFGCYTGDASGFPVEGQSNDYTKGYVDQLLKKLEPPKGAKGNHKFGQITDDSQLTRELIRSIVENGGEFVSQHYANYIGELFKEPFKIVGMGKSTLLSAVNINRGVPCELSGNTSANSNGSAMRSGCLGVLFFFDQNQIQTIAAEQGKCTHNSSICFAGSVAIASSVKLAIECVPTHVFCQRLSIILAPYDYLFSGIISALPELMGTNSKQQLRDLFIREGSLRGEAIWQDGKSISPGVIQSVLWAIYSYLSHPTNYLDCICLAIEVGGDVDTTAAMAGAIVGARVGLSNIPKELVSQVHDQTFWSYNNLMELGVQAFNMCEKQKQTNQAQNPKTVFGELPMDAQ